MACVEAGGGLAGNICSSRPWKMLPSNAANAASASLGSMKCTRAMPLDLRVALRQTCMFHGPATTASPGFHVEQGNASHRISIDWLH